MKSASIAAAPAGRPNAIAACSHRRWSRRRRRSASLVEHLNVAPDALDADVQREDRLEDRRQHEQRKQRRDRRWRPAPPWRSSSAAHAVMPATKIQTRAVPRSRIVARSARVFVLFTAVVISLLRRRRRRYLVNVGLAARVRHCGTGLGNGSARGGSAVRISGSSVTIIPLQSMNYLLDYRSSPLPTTRSGSAQVNRKTVFCVGPLALVGLVTVGVDARPKRLRRRHHAKTTKPLPQSTPPAKAVHDATAYSARTLAVAQGQAGAVRAPSRRRARWPTRSCRATRSTPAATWFRTFARPRRSSTTPTPTRCSGKRTRRAQRSIASITKVMTATVFLENNPDLSQPVTVARSDVFQASTTHLHANDKVTDRRPAAPAADRVGQRRGARARARVAVRLGRLHPPDEREGGRTRTRKHALRRSVGPALRKRVVGLRHGAPHHARVAGRAHLVDHAHARIHRLQRQARRSRSAARTTCSAGGDVDVRAGKTGFISKAGYCLATVLRLPQSGHERRRRRVRRAVERGPLHGIAQSVQLGDLEGVDALRGQAGRAATAAVATTKKEPQRTPSSQREGFSAIFATSAAFLSVTPHPAYPRCIAAASSGSVAIESTATITGRCACRASYALRYRRQTSHA